jgi:hypothetical protein
MTNSIESLYEAIRNPKGLRHLAEQPTKVKKHRYERRKVRSFIRLGAWNEDAAI